MKQIGLIGSLILCGIANSCAGTETVLYSESSFEIPTSAGGADGLGGGLARMVTLLCSSASTTGGRLAGTGGIDPLSVSSFLLCFARFLSSWRREIWPEPCGRIAGEIFNASRAQAAQSCSIKREEVKGFSAPDALRAS